MSAGKSFSSQCSLFNIPATLHAVLAPTWKKKKKKYREFGHDPESTFPKQLRITMGTIRYTLFFIWQFQPQTPRHWHRCVLHCVFKSCHTAPATASGAAAAAAAAITGTASAAKPAGEEVLAKIWHTDVCKGFWTFFFPRTCWQQLMPTQTLWNDRQEHAEIWRRIGK